MHTGDICQPKNARHLASSSAVYCACTSASQATCTIKIWCNCGCWTCTGGVQPASGWSCSTQMTMRPGSYTHEWAKSGRRKNASAGAFLAILSLGLADSYLPQRPVDEYRMHTRDRGLRSCGAPCDRAHQPAGHEQGTQENQKMGRRPTRRLGFARLQARAEAGPPRWL